LRQRAVVGEPVWPNPPGVGGQSLQERLIVHQVVINTAISQNFGQPLDGVIQAALDRAQRNTEYFGDLLVAELMEEP
jgi:hypothetical protein